MSSISCVSAELQHKCLDLTCIGHNPRVTQPSTAHRMLIGKVLNCVVLFYLAFSRGAPGVPYCNDPAVVASFSLAVRRSPRQTSALGLRPTIMAIRSSAAEFPQKKWNGCSELAETCSQTIKAVNKKIDAAQ